MREATFKFIGELIAILKDKEPRLLSICRELNSSRLAHVETGAEHMINILKNKSTTDLLSTIGGKSKRKKKNSSIKGQQILNTLLHKGKKTKFSKHSGDKLSHFKSPKKL